jgi:hypothetical protein
MSIRELIHRLAGRIRTPEGEQDSSKTPQEVIYTDLLREEDVKPVSF